MNDSATKRGEGENPEPVKEGVSLFKEGENVSESYRVNNTTKVSSTPLEGAIAGKKKEGNHDI